MAPELGHYALILALLLASALTVIPMWGSFNGRLVWMSSARSLASGLFVFVALAFLILVFAFLKDDFTVKYVASHSNTLLPTFYKVTAVWGGHEGSVLLWALVLAGWTLAVAIFSRNLPLDMLARVLSVMGSISIGFISFILLTSNPFDRLLPSPVSEGNDLNPLLQDIGMIIHPPMLYMGYVGFSVCFAFAIAALIGGRLDSSWARWSRPWTNMAWAFQTMGLMLGSWWAYYELGWGGWWFWDPVENAAFMPWLVGTALIHSLAVTEKRGVFKSWTIFLAILAFSMSLLGTFIVRSGVLTSVHAFATDPTRGLFILGFLFAVIGGALLLYAIRIPQIRSVQSFNWVSRETFLLLNNIFLVVSTAIVLFGTLYPMIADGFMGQKVSVGPPWFNMFFSPLMMALAVLMGVGTMLNWKNTKLDKLVPWLLAPVAGAVMLGILTPFIGESFRWGIAVTVTLGSWVVLASISDLVRKLRHADSKWKGFKRLSLSYYGMLLAHIGFAISLIGVGVTSISEEKRDVRMAFGEPATIAGYEFELTGVSDRTGPNYRAVVGEVKIHRDGEWVTTLYPENREYFSSRANTMTEAGIDAGLTRDLFVALGTKLSDNAWSMRIDHFPLIRWIWLGCLIMAAGGSLAVLDKRYRLQRAEAEVKQQRGAKAPVTLTKPAEA